MKWYVEISRYWNILFHWTNQNTFRNGIHIALLIFKILTSENRVIKIKSNNTWTYGVHNFFFFFLITKECLKNQGPNPIAPPLSHSCWKKGIGKGTSERIRSCLIACALRIGMGLLTLSLRILNVDFPVKHEIQGESSGPVEEGPWH